MYFLLRSRGATGETSNEIHGRYAIGKYCASADHRSDGGPDRHQRPDRAARSALEGIGHVAAVQGMAHESQPLARRLRHDIIKKAGLSSGLFVRAGANLLLARFLLGSRLLLRRRRFLVGAGFGLLLGLRALGLFLGRLFRLLGV